MAKVSVLLLTINRFFLTREYVGQALANAGYPFDLCITDNGSTDADILEWNEQQNAKIYIKNEKNEGTAQALNKMIDLNPSDYYVFIGNDIRLPNDWLKLLVHHAENVPNSGVSGIDWRGKEYPFRTFDYEGGKIGIWESLNVFGTTFISQTLRKRIGKFCEDYGTYGMWDGDYHIRSNKAGFTNYYLPNMTSHHFGNDCGDNTEYRRMKDASIEAAKPAFNRNLEKYERGEVYIP